LRQSLHAGVAPATSGLQQAVGFAQFVEAAASPGEIRPARIVELSRLAERQRGGLKMSPDSLFGGFKSSLRKFRAIFFGARIRPRR
jgi:hypothetical protein